MAYLQLVDAPTISLSLFLTENVNKKCMTISQAHHYDRLLRLKEITGVAKMNGKKKRLLAKKSLNNSLPQINKHNKNKYRRIE